MGRRVSSPFQRRKRPSGTESLRSSSPLVDALEGVARAQESLRLGVWPVIHLLSVAGRTNVANQRARFTAYAGFGLLDAHQLRFPLISHSAVPFFTRCDILMPTSPERADWTAVPLIWISTTWPDVNRPARSSNKVSPTATSRSSRSNMTT